MTSRRSSGVEIVAILLLLIATNLQAQTAARDVTPILSEQILSPEVAVFQLRDYIVRHVPAPPVASGAGQWTDEAKRLREQLLQQVVFHGWPSDWVRSPARFEEVGVIPANGYRIRKLRYEILPGFWSAALLYEPEKLNGQVPAILNVNGHVGALGKAVEYKQKQCITLAKHGVLALNLEWLGYGEMGQEGNRHSMSAHLNLVGLNQLGVFYLAMRKGLDYLYDHPNVDRGRLGMTGLSGGGWQTIVLSALDERVRVAVPVAGFSSIATRVQVLRYGDIGDFEQSATDLFVNRDYPTLVALMAPRPTLLIYNAEDDCCFRAAVAKPAVFDPIQPFFAIYSKADAFRWYENRDPGTHNYQLDNRRQAYRFFGEHFGLKPIVEDAAVASEIKSYDELVVGLPEHNLTMLELARKMAREIRRAPIPADQPGREAERAKLRELVRFRPARIDHTWTVAVTKRLGIETKSQLFLMSDRLSASGVWAKAIDSPGNPKATILLDDTGKASAAAQLADRVNRGEQVLALDLVFTGAAWEKTRGLQQVIYTLGERPIGIEVAQLIELSRMMKERADGVAPRLETSGVRSQTIALIAAAIKPDAFSEIVVRNGVQSLGQVLERPIAFREAPDLFCLDLLKETDIERLVVLSAPARIRTLAGAN